VKFTVLVVDDEKVLRYSLREVLSREGYHVVEADTGEAAVEAAAAHAPDVVLLDMKLPGKLDGLEVLSRIKEISDETVVIMMTAYASVGTAVEAMRCGAYDYVNKPFKLEEIRLTVRRALDTLSLRKEVAEIRGREKARYSFDRLRSPSPVMQAVYDIARRIAESAANTVLISGESGTGKEVLAKAIHFGSDRAGRPFMDINCTAVPETLLESELFGHEKGAFTDAKTEKQGLFELADGGTLFLDEIGDMSYSTQSKLLRFLEERRFKRVGGISDIEVDVRVIGATNRDLEKAVRDGSFRADLYFRIKVLPIDIPPLRERPEDIGFLAEQFIGDYNREFNKQVTGLTGKAREALLAYGWPGNVRELKNTIERVMILESDDMIRREHLPMSRSQAPGRYSVELQVEDRSLREIERSHIANTLEAVRWNRSEAARVLGIHRTTLYSKMRRYGLIADEETQEQEVGSRT